MGRIGDGCGVVLITALFLNLGTPDGYMWMQDSEPHFNSAYGTSKVCHEGVNIERGSDGCIGDGCGGPNLQF